MLKNRAISISAKRDKILFLELREFIARNRKKLMAVNKPLMLF